jgi:zinc-ribbon domain
MPLVKCPDCGNEISPSAPSCPHCGRPNTAPRPPTKKRMSPVKLTVLIIIAFGVISVAQKCDNKSPASSTHNSAAPVETPEQAAARVKRDQIDKEATVSLTLVEAQNVAVAWCGANDGVITSQTTNTITCRTRYQTQHLMIVPVGNGYVHITRVIE